MAWNSAWKRRVGRERSTGRAYLPIKLLPIREIKLYASSTSTIYYIPIRGDQTHMLAIQKSSRRISRAVVGILALVLFASGGYILTLVLAPVAGPLTIMKPIEVKSLPQPTKANRIVVPKIGVDIAYDKGVAALDRGAEWRQPDRGNPESGGNFIIAAHRFSIQPTPQETIRKSPFYNIDKLTLGDKIIVDYSGKRYGYEIESIKTVKPTQTEIEARSETAKLTLYSCELGGQEAGRVVLVAKPLGLVALDSPEPTIR